MLLKVKRIVELKELSSKLGYFFKDYELLNKSLTHKSYSNEKQKCGLKDNERFEFLGDSVINLAVSRYLLSRNSSLSEGELSSIRAQLVNEQSLARFARQLTLGQYLLLGKGEEVSGGRVKPSLLANATEAVMAAVFIDSDFNTSYEVILRLFKETIDRLTDRRIVADHKGLLQKYCQAHVLSNPNYRLISELGPDHCKTFMVQVYILDEPYGIGIGRTKKEAEQTAAMQSIEQLKVRKKHLV
ncbi:MAG: ribonuclease III [Nitrospinota bacterium]|nr:ribonuclease III [Nitrospinota bacterium]